MLRSTTTALWTWQCFWIQEAWNQRQNSRSRTSPLLMMSTALLWEFLVCRLLLLVVVFLVEEQQTTMTLLLVFFPVEEAVVEDLLFWK